MTYENRLRRSEPMKHRIKQLRQAIEAASRAWAVRASAPVRDQAYELAHHSRSDQQAGLYPSPPGALIRFLRSPR